MEVTNREFWTLIHGMGFGALFLLAFAGGLAGLYSLRPELLTVTGLRERMTRLVARALYGFPLYECCRHVRREGSGEKFQGYAPGQAFAEGSRA